MSAAPNTRIDVARALRDAAWTALLAFGLFLPLIGFLTVQNLNNTLILETRFGLLATFVAITALGRLAYELVIAPMRARGFTPFGIGFIVVYPVIVLTINGTGGAVKWIDNFGIQIMIYVMLGWGLNIVVGLAGLLDLGYVAFYAVGAYSYALL